jgi:hypothetical protein
MSTSDVREMWESISIPIEFNELSQDEWNYAQTSHKNHARAFGQISRSSDSPLLVSAQTSMVATGVLEAEPIRIGTTDYSMQPDPKRKRIDEPEDDEKKFENHSIFVDAPPIDNIAPVDIDVDEENVVEETIMQGPIVNSPIVPVLDLAALVNPDKLDETEAVDYQRYEALGSFVPSPAAPAVAAVSTTTAISAADSVPMPVAVTATVIDEPPQVVVPRDIVIVVQSTVVNLPCLLNVRECIKFVQRWHEIKVSPEAFEEEMMRQTHAVMILVKGKLHDVREDLAELYKTRYANRFRNRRNPYFTSTQQFYFPTEKVLRALFGDEEALQFFASNIDKAEHKHIVCTFCKNEFSLRNNTGLYVAAEWKSRAHQHPDTLTEWQVRVLRDNFWDWGWMKQEEDDPETDKNAAEVKVVEEAP